MDDWLHHILITGGCGFIGTNLLNHLLSKGATDLRILDNLSAGRIDGMEAVLLQHGRCEKRNGIGKITYELHGNRLSADPIRVELQTGDICRKEDCLRAVQDMTAIIHLAAQSGVPVSVENPLFDCQSNVIGTLNMLEACRNKHIDRFIFASSGAPLGEAEPPIHEEKVPHPVSPYGASKLAGEAYCSAYFRTFGIKTVVLRFGNVYGPRSSHKTSVVAKFFKQAGKGIPLEIYGNGTQTRDFIFVEDLCAAIYLSLRSLAADHHCRIGPGGSESRSIAGEIFQIASFKETTVNEIAEKIQALVEQDRGQKVELAYTARRRGDVNRNFSDISKAMDRIGFRPLYDIDKGLGKTWEDFKKFMTT